MGRCYACGERDREIGALCDPCYVDALRANDGRDGPLTLIVRSGAGDGQGGWCQHMPIGDAAIIAYARRKWADVPPRCPACREYLYAYDDGEVISVVVDQPVGAGMDWRE